MQETCDLGLIVALEEEFEKILPSGYESEYDPSSLSYFYHFELGLGNRAYRCTAAFIGGMGPERSALLTERLCGKYHPAVVINVGIAGSLSKSLLLCDVLMAEQVDGYLSCSKIADGENSDSQYTIIPSRDVFKCTYDYLVHCKNFRLAHPDDFKSFSAASAKGLQRRLDRDDIKSLVSRGLLRVEASIAAGHLASGPSVISARAFVDFLKSLDRKYRAVEMEAFGIMLSLQGRKCDSLVIRGISDFCDERKKELDEFKGGAFRELAVENAFQLLTRFADLGLLRYSNDAPKRVLWKLTLSGAANDEEEVQILVQDLRKLNYNDFSLQLTRPGPGSVVLEVSSSQATANRMDALIASSTLNEIRGRSVLGFQFLTGGRRHEYREVEQAGKLSLEKLEELARWQSRKGEYSRGCRLQEIFINRLTTTESVQRPQVLRALANLATYLRWDGDLAEAKRLLDFVIEAWRHLDDVQRDHHWLWATRSNRAELLNKLGRPLEAKTECEEILPNQRMVLGYSHSEVLATQNNLAESYRLTGEVREAILLHYETLSTRLEEKGWHDSDTTVSAWNLSLAYSAAGATEEASELIRRLDWLLDADTYELSPEQRKVRFLLKTGGPGLALSEPSGS